MSSTSTNWNLTHVEEVVNGILSKENVKATSRDHICSQIFGIIRDGPESLQVIMDFDQTMSRFLDDKGDMCDNSYSIFNKALSQNYQDRCKVYNKLYAQILLDDTIAPEIKYHKIVEGYKRTLEDMKLENLYQNEITWIVEKYGPPLRDQLKETMEFLDEMNIPLLVFSAGFGNVIETILVQAGLLFKNIKIVSNFFEFDSTTNKLIGLKEPIIHKFNKDLTTFENEHSNHFADLGHRPNIILVGDQIPDTGMSNGRPSHGKLLNFGFLNTDVDANLPSYLQNFDLVILQDASFSVIYQFLKLITANPNPENRSEKK